MKELMNVREISQILFKHKGKIIITFLATVATVVIATYMMSPTFESTASLLVKYGREFVYRDEVGDERVQAQQKTDMVGIVNAETQILTSQDLVNAVINKVGAKNLYPKFAAKAQSQGQLNDMASQQFFNDLTVKGLEDSGVIQISFDHSNPKMSAKVVNTMVDVFQEKHLQAFTDPKASSFLEQQANAYNQKLLDAEKKLQDLKVKHTTYNLDEQRTLLLHQRSDLDQAYKQTIGQVAELGKKLSELQGQLSTVTAEAKQDTESSRYAVMDDGKTKLLELQMKEQEASKKYTDNSQTMTQLREQISTVQNFLSQQEHDLHSRVPAGNRVYEDVQSGIVETKADYNAAKAKAAALQTQLADLDQRLANLAVPEKEMLDLQRDVTISQQNYQTYAGKMEEARILEDMNRQRMTNISIIQSAAVPADPIKPRKLLNILIGVVFGGLLGIGLAFIAEFLSQSFSTPGSIERRLGVPVLAVVPYRPNFLTR